MISKVEYCEENEIIMISLLKLFESTNYFMNDLIENELIMKNLTEIFGYIFELSKTEKTIKFI